uniref:NADH-ubiquinone oxidoreductase chain 6 n=1 Tax=Scolytinae sp. BMNH 1043104 TaxID=1903796 RepID=A0A343A6B6_9CUCU|nr:NADH dehydrogenase subunit 6 [Scolytinae sp. BMNH 1043104]
MLFIMNWTLSILFIFFKNPLSKGYMLLMLTINTALSASMMYLNSWFGYILFLIMVGGMLVAFIYMTSTASNEKFKSPKLTSMVVMLILTMMMIIMVNDYGINQTLLSTSQEAQNMELMALSKLFYKPFYPIPIALMSYLLLTLIMVAKMTDFMKGPIRQK